MTVINFGGGRNFGKSATLAEIRAMKAELAQIKAGLRALRDTADALLRRAEAAEDKLDRRRAWR